MYVVSGPTALTTEFNVMGAMTDKLDSNTTHLVKRVMNDIWNFDPALMECLSRSDKDFTNHHAAREMTHSISLTYKYEIDCEQIERLKSNLHFPVLVFVSAHGFEIGAISPYLKVTVCYRE